MEDSLREVCVAADIIRGHLNPSAPVTLALVTGSGLGILAELGSIRASISYAKVPGLGDAGVGGHEGRWFLLELENGSLIYCLGGRRHFYEGIEPQATGFTMRILAQLGVLQVVLTNAAGGISERVAVGDLMLIRDHLNFMFCNTLVGREHSGVDFQMPCWGEPYDPAMGALMADVALEEGIELKNGIYAGVCGPSYETRAEVAMFRRWGADAVGMSTVPEVLTACAVGLRVAALSLISNSHVGLTAPPSHEEVLLVARQSGERLKRLLAGFLRRSPDGG